MHDWFLQSYTINPLQEKYASMKSTSGAERSSSDTVHVVVKQQTDAVAPFCSSMEHRHCCPLI